MIDPLLILEPERLAAARQAAAASASAGDPASVQPYVTVSVPFRLLSLLHQGQLELADHDDPGNHWYFGERGELFQYKFIGRHRVESGFTSLVLAHELQASVLLRVRGLYSRAGHCRRACYCAHRTAAAAAAASVSRRQSCRAASPLAACASASAPPSRPWPPAPPMRRRWRRRLRRRAAASRLLWRSAAGWRFCSTSRAAAARGFGEEGQRPWGSLGRVEGRRNCAVLCACTQLAA